MCGACSMQTDWPVPQAFLPRRAGQISGQTPVSWEHHINCQTSISSPLYPITWTRPPWRQMSPSLMPTAWMRMMVSSLSGHETLNDSLKKQRKLCYRTTHYHYGPVQGGMHPQSFYSFTSLGCTHQLLPIQSSLYLLLYTHYILKLHFLCA